MVSRGCVVPRKQRPRLNPILEVWQKRLKLSDWKISIRYEAKEDRPTIEGCEGINYIHGEDCVSVIVIAKACSDVRATVVHELIHIHLDWWRVEAGTAEYELKEKAINMLTAALLEAYPDDL